MYLALTLNPHTGLESVCIHSSWFRVHLFNSLPVSTVALVCVCMHALTLTHTYLLALSFSTWISLWSLSFCLPCFSSWTQRIIFGSEKQTVTQVPSESPEVDPSFSTCSLRAHTHRLSLVTSRRPLAPSSATSPAPEGSGHCSQ